MKKLLIVVDFQKDFITGSLGFPGAKDISGEIVKKIEAYQNDPEGTIVYTLDTHDEGYLSSLEGQRLPVVHCQKGTPGHALDESVAGLLQDCTCFEKPAFGSGSLYTYLVQNPYDQIELCGLVSNICVISNAVLAKTACPEAEILVDSNTTASADSVLHQKALDVMAGLQITVL